jgi:hypothetical protein
MYQQYPPREPRNTVSSASPRVAFAASREGRCLHQAVIAAAVLNWRAAHAGAPVRAVRPSRASVARSASFRRLQTGRTKRH